MSKEMPTPANNNLLWAILFAMVAGILSGWYFGESILVIEWLGDMFLDTLKMIILPLIIAAVISGVTAMGDIRKLGKVGGITILYYVTTTSIAVLIGLIIVKIIEPGSYITDIHSNEIPERIAMLEPNGFSDIMGSFVTSNLLIAGYELNLLPIIVFCLFFAAALTTIGEQAIGIISFFNALNKAMMQLVQWLMYLAPIGIFSLIACRLGKVGGEAFWNEISTVGWYCLTVLIGLFIHFLVLLSLLHIFSNYGINYLKHMLKALLTAFSTASSAATLPITMDCSMRAGINKKSSQFVLPLGATINMDGTALYEAVAVMFIAQAYGYHMGLANEVIIFVTATLAAIGAAGIPQAGLVTMVIVLTAVNLPLEGIGLLLAVDWFLDRFRTMINVWGDATGTAIIDRIIKHE